MFEKIKRKGFQVLALHHAEAILKHDMTDAVAELERVLLDVQIPIEALIRGGGGETELTQRMRRAFGGQIRLDKTQLRNQENSRRGRKGMYLSRDRSRKTLASRYICARN